MANRCFLEGRGPCDGRIDPHHLIPQGRIKREYPRGVWRLATGELVKANRQTTGPFGNVARVTLGMLLEDRRNLISVCRRHHDQLHWKRERIELPDLPAEAHEFARELGMMWSLERDYPRREWRTFCPKEGCFGLEWSDDGSGPNPDGCGHPTITSGCEGRR